MKLLYFIVMIGMMTSAARCQNTSSKAASTKKKIPFEMNLSEEEWKKRLTPEEFYVLRQKGTERPFTGKFYKHFDEGTYVCKGCGNELFDSESKFDSHCGWPSYDRTLSPGSIVEKPDYSYGMIRTEVLCSRCGGHLGHVFDDGPTSTGLRYCINSVAIDFKKKDK